MAEALADSSVKTHCLPWTSVLRRAAPAARLPERRERLGSHGCPDVEKSWYKRKPDGNGKPLSRPNLT